MKKTLVLMATYNGEKYIRRQIDSILQQTFQNLKLIIRDDGSKDGTVDIIRDYAQKDSRVVLLQNKTSKHGAYLNFWTLIDYAKKNERFDYCFFSDQDDIWKEYKIQKMIDFAEQYDPSEPLLVYSDMTIIDGEDQVTIPSLNAVMGIGKMSGMTEFFSAAFVWGCNAMINDQLMKRVPVFPLDDNRINVLSHDNYYTKFCLIIGKVGFVPAPCILHRRHDSNVTSGNTLKLSLRDIIVKSTKNYDKTSKVHAGGYYQTLLTIKMMKKAGISSEIIDDIEKAIKKGGIYGTKTLFKYKVKRQQMSRTIGVYMIMLFNSYQKYLREMR